MLSWQKIKSHLPLLIILVVAAFFRLVSLNHSRGIHPDERHMIMVAEGLSLSKMNPESFAYGSFPYYLLWGVAEVLGFFSPWLSSYDGLFSVGRVLCALFGLAAIALIYKLALSLYSDKLLAIVAAALLAFNPFHLQLSRFYTVDVVLTTLCLAAVMAMLEIARGKDSSAFALTGFVFGLALATKVSAMFLLAPLGAAFLLRLFSAEQRTNPHTWLGLGALALVTGVTFLLVEPYALLDYHKFIAQTNEQTSMVRGLWRPPYTIQYAHTMPWFYALKQLLLYTMGWPVAAAVFVSLSFFILRQLRKPRREEIIFLALLIPTFAVYASFQVKFPRYLLPLYPLLFLIAADGLVRLARLTPRLVSGSLGLEWQLSSRTMAADVSGSSADFSSSRAGVATAATAGAWLRACVSQLFTPARMMALGGVALQIAALVGTALGSLLISEVSPANPGAWLLIFLCTALFLLGTTILCGDLDKRLPLSLSELEIFPRTWAGAREFILPGSLQAVCLVAALALWALSMLYSFSTQGQVMSGWLWLGAIILFLAAWLSNAHRFRNWELLLLGFAILCALVLRLAHLENLPWFVHGDEGEQARIALEIAQGKRGFFEPGFLQLPGLGNALQAPFISLFGLGISGARTASAFLGSLTLIAVYLMFRQFAGRAAALLGAGLFVTFHVHLWFSRVALTNVQLPLFGALSAYYLALAFDHRSLRWSAAAGTLLGIGAMLNPAGQIQMYCSLACMLWLILRQHEQRWIVGRLVLGLVFGLAIGLGPGLVKQIAAPSERLAQAQIGSLFEEGALQRAQENTGTGGAVGVIGAHTFYNLLAPVSQGNRSDWWYGLHKRMFEPLLAALYLIGLLSVFAVALSRRFAARESLELAFRHTLPVFVVFGAALMCAFSRDVPAWNNLIAVLPFVVLIPCAVFAGTAQFLASLLPAGRLLSLALGSVILMRAVGYDLRSFYGDESLTSAKQPLLQTYLVRAISEIPLSSKVYLFTGLPDNLPTYPTYYNYGSIWLSRPGGEGKDINLSGETLAGALPGMIDSMRDAALVFYGSDQGRILPYLKRLYPQGYLRSVDLPPFANQILIYNVPKGSSAD